MTPAAIRILRAGADVLGVPLDEGTVERLGRYLETLAVWNRTTRLTSARDLEDVIRKHVLDCLALVRFLPAEGLVVDIGSGAGFPGVVLGCVRPDLDLTLIESRRRRASFLRAALRAAELGRAEVVETRAEDAAGRRSLAGRAAIVTGRAVRLEILFRLARPFLSPDGRVLTMLGARAERTALGLAAGFSLHPVGAYDYLLPGGENHLVLAFAPFPGKPA